MDICFKAIGTIHSPYTKKDETPIQGAFSDAYGTVEIFPEYAEGLKDIQGFSHLYLIYYFNRAETHSLIQKPFLDSSKSRGIFATRHYNRPNHIGLSIVELLSVKGNVLEIGSVDILDGTPLLDIKPYVKKFDLRKSAKSGWFDELPDSEAKSCTPGGLRARKSISEKRS